MAIVEPLHEEFGARVTGIDLSDPESLSEEAVEEIHALIDAYSFVLFPGQRYDDDRQLAFTRRLGEPEVSHVKFGEEGVIEYFGTIGNVLPDGTTRGNSDRRTIFQTGNNMWHSDASFREVPAYVSIMCAYEVPEEGGLTQFVSQRAAYSRLPEETKATVDPLVVVHDYVFSRSKIGADAVKPSLAASLPPVRQRLVRTNKREGAKNYFVGSHAKEIEGWSEADSRRLIEGLIEEATAPEHVYTHAWQPADLVIWDNRCLLHCGTGYDADRYRRYMRQTRVRGACNSLQE